MWFCEGMFWLTTKKTSKPHIAMDLGGESAIDRCIPHCSDVIMGAIASQIASLTIVHSTVYSGADHRKHQNSASLAFVRGIHREPVNSPHKGPVTRKMFPFDDVITWNTEIVSMSGYQHEVLESHIPRNKTQQRVILTSRLSLFCHCLGNRSRQISDIGRSVW